MKQRQTVIECDGFECDEHVIGADLPDTWLSVRIMGASVPKPVRLTVCSLDCLGSYCSISEAEPVDETVA